MHRTFMLALLVAGVVALAGFYVLTTPSIVPPNAFGPRVADVANGATMFDIGGCASCHAAAHHEGEGQSDHLRLSGGLELPTPFGSFIVPNISPDPVHGIGDWTEMQFANAVLKGVGKHGEHLYPALPYSSYQRMTIDDVRDLFAYIKTLPADPTPSRPHKLGFPFNVRRGLGLWKLAFIDGRAFVPAADRDAIANRGAYLVEGPGHCAECHSRRNFAGAIIEDGRMAGGPTPQGKGFIPNITQHEDGLAEWSVKDIETLLKSGVTPEGSKVGDEMADVVANTSRLGDADRHAMAVYIKSLPPKASVRDKK